MSPRKRRELEDLDTEYIECRGPLKHKWYYIDPPKLPRGHKGYGHELVSVKCDNCGKERHEAWHRRTGELLYRRYKDPAGYSSISRRWKNNDFRLELIKRWRTRG